MKCLLDTHLLIWVAENSTKLSLKARALIGDIESQLFFSLVSIWEIAIKSSLGRDDFETNAEVLRSQLLENGYIELTVEMDHIVSLTDIPMRHNDPFDRMLIAQAKSERLTLLTSDHLVVQYGGNIVRV